MTWCFQAVGNRPCIALCLAQVSRGLACTTQGPDLMDIGLEGLTCNKCPVSQAQVETLGNCGWTAHPSLEIKVCLHGWGGGPSAWDVSAAVILPLAMGNWFSLLCSTIDYRTEALVMSQHLWTNLLFLTGLQINKLWSSYNYIQKPYMENLSLELQFWKKMGRKQNTYLHTEKRKKKNTKHPNLKRILLLPSSGLREQQEE